MSKNELIKKGADFNASLALEMKEGVQVKDDLKGRAYEILITPSYSTHGYDPEKSSMNTVFLASGININHVDVQNMELTDVAPFIAKLLGLNFDAPDGKLIPGIISNN